MKSYIKGCRFHWKQSTERVSGRMDLVPQQHLLFFGQQIKIMGCTTERTKFNEAVTALRSRFPKLLKWLKWWEDPKNGCKVTFTSIVHYFEIVVS